MAHPPCAVRSFKLIPTRLQPRNRARNRSCPPHRDVIRLMPQSDESAATHLAAGAGKAVLAPTYGPSRTRACAGDRGQHLPFFRAWAMTSAALLLITLVTYRGQLVWLAMVMERFTASASTCRRASQCETCVHCSVSSLSSCLPSTHREGLQ